MPATFATVLVGSENLTSASASERTSFRIEYNRRLPSSWRHDRFVITGAVEFVALRLSSIDAPGVLLSAEDLVRKPGIVIGDFDLECPVGLLLHWLHVVKVEVGKISHNLDAVHLVCVGVQMQALLSHRRLWVFQEEPAHRKPSD